MKLPFQRYITRYANLLQQSICRSLDPHFQGYNKLDSKDLKIVSQMAYFFFLYDVGSISLLSAILKTGISFAFYRSKKTHKFTDLNKKFVIIIIILLLLLLLLYNYYYYFYYYYRLVMHTMVDRKVESEG